MASAASSAAAARSSDDGAAMAILPDGEGGGRDENTDKVAKRGLHAMCPYCNKGPYVRYTNLAAHVQVHHPGEKPPPRLQFACMCHGRLFGHRWLRDQHERDAVRTVCPHCGREMARSNLRRHVHRCRYRPGGPAELKYQCTECGLAFMTERGEAATDPLVSQRLTDPQVGFGTPQLHTGTPPPQNNDARCLRSRSQLRRHTQKHSNVILGRLLNRNTAKGPILGLFDLVGNIGAIIRQNCD